MFGKNSQIAYLNDKLRKNLIGGKVVLTQGVDGDENREEIVKAVQDFKFDKNDKENNHYGENDFGAVDIKGEKFYFKIDYYDKELSGLSSNPASSDEEICKRVMTIMCASEY